MVNTDFFISPAYCEPPISTILRVKSIATTVSERTPWRFGIGLEAREVEDGEVGHEACELFQLGADQQRADEERVPGEFGEDAGLDAEGGIGAAVEILGVERFAFGVLDEIVEESLELVRGDRLVAAPPHGFLGGRIAHREFVFRRAARMRAGFRGQRAFGGDRRFAGSNRELVERGRAEVPLHLVEFFETEFVGAEGTVVHARLFHEVFLLEPADRLRGCRKPPVAGAS